MEGTLPLGLRFLHDPKATEGNMAGALFCNMVRFYKTSQSGENYTHSSKNATSDMTLKDVDALKLGYFRIHK